jgi:hypothetical protein
MPDDGDRQHGKQLAHEHRIHRNRGRQDLDDLVALFLDQVGQHHRGQQHDEEEQQQLPALRGLVATAVLVCTTGGNGCCLHVRVAAHLA